MGTVVALAGLAGSLLLIGQATAPLDQGVAAAGSTTTSTSEALSLPTTTTTIDFANFTISAIATGERLSWIRAPSLVSGWPIDLIDFEGRLWLFTATGESGPYRLGAGLEAWVSPDGVDWRPAGKVVDEQFTVARIETVGESLVVMGSRLSDGAPHVWLSDDGTNWSVSALPIPSGTLAPGYRTWFAGAAGTEVGLIVAGFVEPSSEAEIVERLPEDVASFARDFYGIGLNEGPDGVRSVEVYGPLGLLGYSATLGELGIATDAAIDFFGGNQVDRSFLWTSKDGAEWSSEEIGDLWAQQLAVMPDGSIMVLGGDQMGQGLWSSKDGSSWDRTGLGPHYTWLIGSRGDELLAVAGDRDLVTSTDGVTWETLGADESLPDRLYWNLGPFAWDETHLAAIATTYPDTVAIEAVAVTVEENGNSLTFDPNTGTVTVSNGTEMLTVQTWNQGQTSSVAMDFTTEEVTFLRPGTGEPIATFSFETLRRAETAALGEPDPGIQALLLQRPEGGWSVIDLADGIGPAARIFAMTFFGDQLAVLTTTSLGPTNGEPTRFTVRLATLP